MATEPIEVFEGSGNVYADLGLPDADTHYIKSKLVVELYRLTTALKLTQAKTAERLGITQPEVSRLFKGRFREYSVERLMNFLTAFDQDVEITVRPHPKAGEGGKITFTLATA